MKIGTVVGGKLCGMDGCAVAVVVRLISVGVVAHSVVVAG